jgi:hypothetical protein
MSRSLRLPLVAFCFVAVHGGVPLRISAVLLGILIPAHAHSQGASDSEQAQPFKGAKSVVIKGGDWPADQTDYPIEIICHKGEGND